MPLPNLPNLSNLPTLAEPGCACVISVVAAPVVGLGCDFLAFLGIMRVFGKWPYVRKHFCSFCLGLAATFALTVYGSKGELVWATDADTLGLLFLNACVYVAFANGFFHFVNLNVTSLRIRMLQEVLESGSAGLDSAELLKRHTPENIADVRLERLVRGKQLILRDGRYYTKFSGVLLIAKILDTLRRLILGRKILENIDLPNSSGPKP